MRFPGKHCSVAVAIVCCLFASPPGGAAELPPVEAFSRLPFVEDARISPNGAHLAYLVNDKGGAYIVTRTAGEPDRIVIRSGNDRVRFNWFRWANDERLLVSGVFPIIYKGLLITRTRMLSVPRDGSAQKVFTVPTRKFQPQYQDEIVSMLPDDPKHVLVALDDEIHLHPSVYRLDVETGERREVEGAREPIRRWIVDQQDHVRVGIGYNAGVSMVFVRDPNRRKWREIWRHEVIEEPPVSPMGFGADPDLLYVRALHEGRKAVFVVDLKDLRKERTLVASNPRYDIEGSLIYSPRTRDVVGVYGYGADGDRIYWDESYRNLQESIDQEMPDTNNELVRFSDDERRYLVFSYSDRNPGVFYLGDRDTGKLHAFGERYPELSSLPLSGKIPMAYEARDGLQIEGYLTSPWGEPPAPWPLVVLPHGGPWARDDDGFDFEVEFLASRGYAVFQMNFRGSSGYGWDFESAAYGGLGGKMQDDITDGVRWLIAQGLADAGRIAIMGMSYGGYAALWGAVKEPDLFRCAISVAGVSDWLEMLYVRQLFARPEVIRRLLGKRSALKEVSPLRHADTFAIPVLLLHGDEDRVVPVEQSRRMAKALRKRGKVVRYVELENGSHSLTIQRNRTAVLLEVEQFLAEHMRPAAPAATPTEP